jgi:RimJ/RimL family protein N-acetyltransferase
LPNSGVTLIVENKMIIEATASDFDALLGARAPRNLQLVPDSAIAPADVLKMLSNLAGEIHNGFAPSAWMIAEDGEVVGLCSVARMPVDGELHIGYGIAPSRQGTGAATRAIAALVQWARTDTRVSRITADTAIENIASQRVLERNGFSQVDERIDPEDGRLICWELRITK